MELRCMLRLSDDKDGAPPHRVSEIMLNVESQARRGTWTLLKGSKDPRIAVGASSGLWTLLYEEEKNLPTLAVMREEDYRILFLLYAVSQRDLSKVGCGSSLGGDGWHQGPPESDINFSIWFSCV